MERGVIVRGIMLGVAAMAVVAAASALWVILYSLVIAPGHDGGQYQAYAQRVAPYAAIIVGLPVFLSAGWLAARGRRPMAAALLPALTYVALDVALMATGGTWPSLGLLAASWLTKFASGAAGGWLVGRRRTTS